MGGVERVTKNIYERLMLKGYYDVTIYSTTLSYQLLGWHKIKKVKIKTYFAFAPFNAYYLPSPLMFKDLLSANYDIIHIYNIHSLTAIVGYLAKKRSKLVISPYYHGRGHSRFANTLWTPYRSLVKKILFKADVIIVNSDVQKKLLLRDFRIPVKKLYLVYDGVNLEGIKDANPYEIDDKIILYVGRLERYKNVHLGILALKYLPLKFKYVIIGRGPYENKLKEITVNNNLQDRVIFLGHQPDHVVWRWLKTASVFIHLSEVESFGMTCIEALAAGCPVVANDDGLGLSETISLYPNQIFVYKVNSEPVNKLAEKIILASEMKPISADVNIFSWEKIVERIDYVYRKVLL
jgi:glycosyltransferase involved in cell wall biosynthesis